MALPLLRRALLAACILATLAAAGRGEVVFDGVAAGDASSTDAILWTRADNGGSTTSLTAQVATDQGFANIVATLGGTTGSEGCAPSAYQCSISPRRSPSIGRVRPTA